VRRYVVQIGMGVDLHGQNATVAAQRAIRDAIGTNSLPGLRELGGIKSLDQMIVEVIIACPYPAEHIDSQKVLEVLPFGQKTLRVVPGGMLAPSGSVIKDLGDTSDDIVVCNACVIVGVPD